MKKTLLSLLFLLTSTLTSAFGSESCLDNNIVEYVGCPNKNHNKQCAYSDSYRYFSLGIGPVILLPNLGIGYRQHNLRHGFDMSLSVATAIRVHSVQGNLLYHFYPNPYRNDPWYVGAGVGTTWVFVNDYDGYDGWGGIIAPDLVLGKELLWKGKNKHFIEAHVQGSLGYPVVSIKYGMAF